MMAKAKDILVPEESGILRVVFLYVGQGEATLMAIPNGDSYEAMLIDTNLDKKLGGVNIPKLVADLGGNLDYFVNTHPHKDHLKGLAELREEGVKINNVWHSDHEPGEKDADEYEELKKLIEEIGSDNAVILKGTREDQSVGDVAYNILAPADYVKGEIEDEEPEQRDARIHEHCAVIRFRYGDDEKQILITGDADLDAWKNHITDYHAERLPSTVLSAPHHGSKSFFVKDEEDEPYLDHIENIKPEYVVISAPKSEESPHGHPDKEATDNYEKYVAEDGLLHLGKNRECVIVDIRRDGGIEVFTDGGELAEEYGFAEDNDSKDEKKLADKVGSVAVATKLDDKPMGKQ